MDISPAYLLCGSEEYLINNYKKRLLEALLISTDSMNFNKFSGAGADVAAIANAVSTMPFFSDRRVVLIEDTGLFKSSSEAFLHAMEQIPETTVVICAEKNVDKRLAPYKLFKKSYKVMEFDMPVGPDLEKWAVEKLMSSGLRIKRDAWQLFLDTTTADEKMKNMSYMDNELEKLISYCAGRDAVTISDVQAITSGYADDNIFSLLEAIAASEPRAVIKCYEQMLLCDKNPGEIIRMIIWEFRRIYNAGELYSDGMSASDIASRVGMQDWQIKKHIKAGHFKSFPPHRAKRAIEKAAATLYEIRRGNIDEKIGAELLMLELTSQQQS